MRRRAAVCCCGGGPGTPCQSWTNSCLGSPPKTVTVSGSVLYQNYFVPFCDNSLPNFGERLEEYESRLQFSVTGTWNGGTVINVSGSASIVVSRKGYVSDFPPPGPCYPYYLCSTYSQSIDGPLSGTISCAGGNIPGDNAWNFSVDSSASAVCTTQTVFSAACGGGATTTTDVGFIILNIFFRPGSGCQPNESDLANVLARGDCGTLPIASFTFDTFSNTYFDQGFSESQSANISVVIT